MFWWKVYYHLVPDEPRGVTPLSLLSSTGLRTGYDVVFNKITTKKLNNVRIHRGELIKREIEKY